MGKRGPKPKFVGVACPNDRCSQFGINGQGNIIGNGSYSTKSGRIRKYICTGCRAVFCERTNTIFYDLRTGEEKVLLALRLLLNGKSLRSIAEVLEIGLDTVIRWLTRAADQSEDVNKVLMREFELSLVELDEFWTIVGRQLHRG
jgi:transposase-like protein